MVGSLRVCLVLLAVWLPVMSRGRFQNLGDRPKPYNDGRDTMLFVIEWIPGGDTVDDIAKKHGFENTGKVGKSVVPVWNTS